MGTLESIVSLTSGLLGILTPIVALVVHKRRLRLSGPPPASAAHLRSYGDEAGLAKTRLPAVIRPTLVATGILLLIPAGLRLAHGNIQGGLLLVVFAVAYVTAAYRAGRARSRSFKSASLTIELPAGEAMRRAHDTLKRIGLRIVSFDLEEGVVQARRGSNLSLGTSLVAHRADLPRMLTPKRVWARRSMCYNERPHPRTPAIGSSRNRRPCYWHASCPRAGNQVGRRRVSRR